MDITSESALKKPKRLTSVVWNHFERVTKNEVCYAVCIHCTKKLSGSSNSGTTHLRNHLMRCLRRSNFDISQLLVKKRKKENSHCITNISADEEPRNEENIVRPSFKYEPEPKIEEVISLGSARFEQEWSRFDLTRMIILHGYPLSMVDHVGFKIFVKNLQPLFDPMTKSALEDDCMLIYEKEKQKVYEMIKKFHGRTSLAVDLWTSPENARYLCMTVHYIDEDWKLQKKTLNFVTINSSHTEDMLSEGMMKSLMDWDIEQKLFSLTCGDSSTNDDVVYRIKDRLSQARPLLSNGQFFDVRCAAHVLNLLVQDAMDTLKEVTHKIRETVMYVKSSQMMQGKFNEIAQQAGVEIGKSLLLDTPNHWNSTHLMLETALEYKAAFSQLQESDTACTMVPSDEEWEWSSSILSCLKLFVEITNVFTGNKCLTANLYFPEICDLHIHLLEWCKNPDDFISSMALKMKAKFDKYWSKCSLVLVVAAVLDPRFKMKLVEYYYTQIYASDAPDHIRDISDGIRELFNEYTISSSSPGDHGSGWPGNCLSDSFRDRLKGFDKFLHETQGSQSIVSDLDKYLEEPVFPRNFDFNILEWWKVHTPRYPVLSMMARDVLGVPMSTIQPESAFSTRGKVLDHYRSSLDSDIRQALICTQDWLRTELEGSNLLSGRTAPAPHLLIGN